MSSRSTCSNPCQSFLPFRGHMTLILSSPPNAPRQRRARTRRGTRRQTRARGPLVCLHTRGHACRRSPRDHAGRLGRCTRPVHTQRRAHVLWRRPQDFLPPALPSHPVCSWAAPGSSWPPGAPGPCPRAKALEEQVGFPDSFPLVLTHLGQTWGCTDGEVRARPSPGTGSQACPLE